MTAPSDPKALAERPCTCHPSDGPPICQRRYAQSECQMAYLTTRLAEVDRERDEARERIGHYVTHLSNRERDLAAAREALAAMREIALRRLPDEHQMEHAIQSLNLIAERGRVALAALSPATKEME